ncbi:alpha/beta hydrolase domain-containing protein [Streptomyces sp. S465]|uniref:alpha/beta hydrolase domain-containing protein n=1 Tax=Streptomyces sp. S465 TaxID=2979468 RepID=UPI0022A86489|nr:alpha/beta hydrolase domain-containing protein [Streptomyces sp. S465]WAP53567.1 alpha/beta hydrolase domain-containing protein [Streptomyces sp. S465]
MTLHLRELPVTPGSSPLGTSHLPDQDIGVDLAPLGYTEREFLVSGTAGEYRHRDGVLERTGERPFTTRVLVRTPAPERFNGVVQAEPLHPDYDSAGTWRMAHGWITATGAAWVGITQDHRSAATLRDDYDPDRYRDVSIPAAGLRWDIVGHILTALRTPGPSVLHDLAERVSHVYLSGWSNTGSFCRVFLQDGFHARHRLRDSAPAVDGYLIGISSGAAGDSGYPPLADGSPSLPHDDPRRVIGPADVPVFEVLSELESETHRCVLRPDGDTPDDRYRLYQVAGTSHHSPLLSSVLTNSAQFRRLGHDVSDWRITEETSDAQLDAVARAAYALLHRWAAAGQPPPHAERFSYAAPDGSVPPGTAEELLRDAYGNVRGGVRTPWVEAPLAAYSPHSTPAPGSCRPSPWAPLGSPELVAGLIGHMTPLPAEQVAALYADRQDYLNRFEAACDRLTAQGLLLEPDAHDLLVAARRRPFPRPSEKGQLP